MAVKPSVSFTWSTDLNFGSGPATGNPTKVNPPGWTANLQGFIPGLAIVAEHKNTLFNNLGLWTGWLAAGVSDPDLDAHIVETNSLGDLNIGGFNFRVGNDGLTPVKFTRNKNSGTGADDGSSLEFHGQPGRDETGANANNDGGITELYGGIPGTGGSGAAGQPGPVGAAFPAFGGDRKLRSVEYGRKQQTLVPGLFTIFQEPVVAITIGNIISVTVTANAVRDDGFLAAHLVQRRGFFVDDNSLLVATGATVLVVNDSPAPAITLDVVANELVITIDQVAVGLPSAWNWGVFVDVKVSEL